MLGPLPGLMTSRQNVTLTPMTCATNTATAPSRPRAGTWKIAVNATTCTPQPVSPGRSVESRAPHSLAARNVLWSWFLALFVGTAVSAIALLATDHASTPTNEVPIWATSVGVVAMWVAMLAVLYRTRPETPHVNADALTWFRIVDLVGVPLGIFCQFIVVTAVTWPLQKLWPDSFSSDQVSKRATDLTNTAPGIWILLLIVVVVAGAPLVEEIVYRQVVQQDLVQRWGKAGGVVVTAAVFAAVHMQLVEFAGLFAFALVLGVVRQRTGRLGTSIITHMAFNAAGLLMVILK
jgi:membrane protease YdiL (CAAX protease family)